MVLSFCKPKAMDKTSQSVKGDPSVNRVMGELVIDLNQLPDEVEMVDLNVQPKDDVPPLPHFDIDLCFHKEDMEVLKQQYKVLGSSSVTSSDHFQNLGFHNGCTTFICTRNKRVQFPRKSFHTLGRSWFKGGFTEKDKQQDVDYMKSLPEPMCVEVTEEGDKNKEKRDGDDTDHLAAKELLQEFVKQAKARARNAGKKIEKQVRSSSVPRCGKKKKTFVPKMQSLKEIMSNDKEPNA